MQSAALIYANGIGDHILTLPTVRALSRFFEGRLQLISFPDAKQRHYLGVRFSSFVPTIFKDRSKGEKAFDAEAVARQLGNCPLLISLNPWHSDSMNRFLDVLKPKVSIGFNEAFQAHIPLDYDRHSTDMTFDIARVLDPKLRVEDFAASPRLVAHARRRVLRLFDDFPSGSRVLVVHADTRPWKEWRAEYFRAALHGFLGRHAEFLALVVGQQDRGLEKGPHADRVIPCLGLHPHLSMAMVQKADLFLGIDSCALHMADICRTPGVGLFGATRALEWGFRFGPHVHVDCGKSMNRDAVSEVMEALEQMSVCAKSRERAKACRATRN